MSNAEKRTREVVKVEFGLGKAIEFGFGFTVGTALAGVVLGLIGLLGWFVMVVVGYNIGK